MTANYFAAVAALPPSQAPSSPFTVGTGAVPCGVGPSGPWVSAPLTNFFRPGGLNPSIAAAFQLEGAGACVTEALAIGGIHGFNTACNPNASNGFSYTGCVPFSDMDANYSNGSSVYHGLTANLRKRFTNHYEFLASYTWSHAIDDSTDLQATHPAGQLHSRARSFLFYL
jgi:hypothetical protein